MIALLLGLVLDSPPEPESPEIDAVAEPATVEPESEVAEPSEEASDLDCMLDDCEAGEAVPANETAAADSAAAEELKTRAKGLAATGQHAEAIEVYKQAYELAPGDHIIAYEIASSAQKLGRCSTMREYLEHFVRYADPNSFPNKIDKARRALDSASCVTHVDSELRDAVSAGAVEVHVMEDGDGLVGGGVAMVGVGILAFGAGVALAAIGLHRIASGDPMDALKNRNLVIAGGVIGPSGVAFIAGGGVMIARGNQPGYVAISPTGLTVRF